MSDSFDKLLNKIQYLRLQPSPEEIEKVLEQANREFDVTSLIVSSPNYNPKLLFKFILVLLPFVDLGISEVTKSVFRFFDKLIPILLTYSSSDFLKYSHRIFDKEKPKSLIPLLRYIATAIAFQYNDNQGKYIKMGYDILKVSSDSDKQIIFPLFFQTISKHCSLEECVELLDTMKVPGLANAAANLCMNHTNELVQLVLKRGDDTFLNPFFVCYRAKNPVDATEFINSLMESTNTSIVNSFLSSQIVLATESVEPLKNLCQKLVGDLSSSQGKDKANLINALNTACQKGFMDSSLLKDEVNFNSMSKEVKTASVKLYVTYLYDDYKEVFEQILKAEGESLTILIDNFSTCVKQVYQDDQKWSLQFILKLIEFQETQEHTLLIHQGESLYSPLLKVINAIPMEDVLVQKVKKIITKCKTTSDPVIAAHVYRALKKYKVGVKFTDLDWFGNVRCALEIIRSPDTQFISELLHTGFIQLSSIKQFLRALRLRPRASASTLFLDVIALMKMCAHPLGGHIDPENIIPEINWFEQSEIDNLFLQSNAPFIFSNYGSLALELIRTLASMYPFFEQNKEEQICLVIMRFILLFASSFPEQCVNFAIEIHKNFPSDEITKIMDQMTKEEHPYKYAPFFFKCACEVHGFEQACSMDKEILLQAIRYDREIASKLAEKLDQPLNTLRTFLSFVGVEKHKEWVNQCQHELNVDEWILLPTDIDLVKQLPEDDEETKEKHKQAIAKIEGIPYVVNETDEVPKQESPGLISVPSTVSLSLSFKPPFIYKEAEIPKAPKSHKYEDSNLPNLISFLWFSEKKLDNEEEVLDYFYNQYDSIESDYHKDKFLLGILIYCQKHSIQLKETVVAEKLNAKSDFNILACALFFRNMHDLKINALPEHIEKCLSRILKEIHVNRDKLVDTYIQYKTCNLYNRPSIHRDTLNLHLFLLESIIQIDSTLIKQIRTDNEAELIEKLKPTPGLAMQTTAIAKETILFALALFYDYYFKPFGVRMYRQLPTTYEWPTLLYSFTRESKPFTFPYLSKEVRQLIMDLIKQRIKRYLTLIQWINPTEEELMSIHQGWRRWRFLFPSLYFKDMKTIELNDDLKKYFNIMPPSYTRRFSRSLFVQCSPMIPQKFFEEVKLYLAPVHGSVIPKDSQFLILPSGDSLPKDIANAGYQSAVLDLYKEAQNGDALSYTLLCKFNDDIICKEVKLSDPSIVKSDMALKLINNSISTVRKTIAAINAVSTHISPGELVAIIANRNLVNSPNFLAVCVAFSMTEKIVKDTEYSEMLTAYRDPSLNIITNEHNRELFANLTEERVAEVIHTPPPEESSQSILVPQ